MPSLLGSGSERGEFPELGSKSKACGNALRMLDTKTPSLVCGLG